MKKALKTTGKIILTGLGLLGLMSCEIGEKSYSGVVVHKGTIEYQEGNNPAYTIETSEGKTEYSGILGSMMYNPLNMGDSVDIMVNTQDGRIVGTSETIDRYVDGKLILAEKIVFEEIREVKVWTETERRVYGLKLNIIENTVVHIPTVEEYWELMKVCEIGGWEWFSYGKPTSANKWGTYEENTCINAGITLGGTEKNFKHYKKDRVAKKSLMVISIEEFYKRQNISPELLKEIEKIELIK